MELGLKVEGKSGVLQRDATQIMNLGNYYQICTKGEVLPPVVSWTTSFMSLEEEMKRKEISDVGGHLMRRKTHGS